MPRVPLGAVAPSPGVPLGTQTRHLAVTHLAWWDRVLADLCDALSEGMGVYDAITVTCALVGAP